MLWILQYIPNDMNDSDEYMQRSSVSHIDVQVSMQSGIV